MNSRVAIVYPDYLEAASAAGFDAAIVDVVPDAVYIAALHAPAGHALSAQDATAAGERTRTLFTRSGFNAAVLGGLARAVTLDVVLRIDPASPTWCTWARCSTCWMARRGRCGPGARWRLGTSVAAAARVANAYHHQTAMPMVRPRDRGSSFRVRGE